MFIYNSKNSNVTALALMLVSLQLGPSLWYTGTALGRHLRCMCMSHVCSAACTLPDSSYRLDVCMAGLSTNLLRQR